uniref:ZAD domain-containing protein n=2 Tax=Lutzomyia longipalpis TaxID=7200 RepID=A0A1B0CDD0_LUTLO
MDNQECRICMTPQNNSVFVDIFVHTIVTGNTELYLCDAIQELTDLKIYKGDGKPEAICQDCESRLHSAYELKILAEESDKKFVTEEVSMVEEEEKKTIIERYEYSVETKEDGIVVEKEDEETEEIDAVSFVLKFAWNILQAVFFSSMLLRYLFIIVKTLFFNIFRQRHAESLLRFNITLHLILLLISLFRVIILFFIFLIHVVVILW